MVRTPPENVWQSLTEQDLPVDAARQDKGKTTITKEEPEIWPKLWQKIGIFGVWKLCGTNNTLFIYLRIYLFQ